MIILLQYVFFDEQSDDHLEHTVSEIIKILVFTPKNDSYALPPNPITRFHTKLEFA